MKIPKFYKWGVNIKRPKFYKWLIAGLEEDIERHHDLVRKKKLSV